MRSLGRHDWSSPCSAGLWTGIDACSNQLRTRAKEVLASSRLSSVGGGITPIPAKPKRSRP